MTQHHLDRTATILVEIEVMDNLMPNAMHCQVVRMRHLISILNQMLHTVSDTTPSVPMPCRSPQKANHMGLQVHQSTQLGRQKAVSFEEPVTHPPKRRKTKDMVQNLTHWSTRSSRVVD